MKLFLKLLVLLLPVWGIVAALTTNSVGRAQTVFLEDEYVNHRYFSHFDNAYFNPLSESANFNTIFLRGCAVNYQQEGVFEGREVESVTIDFGENLFSLDRQIVLPANAKGVQTGLRPIEGCLDFYDSTTRSGYDVWVSLYGIEGLQDGRYVGRILFRFIGGAEYLVPRPFEFNIDQTPPGLSIYMDHLNKTVIRGGKEIRKGVSKDDVSAYIDCDDSENVCGIGGLRKQRVDVDGVSHDIEIKVKGNFCDTDIDNDGVQDRLCDPDPSKRTYEVCDGAGNCTIVGPELNGHLIQGTPGSFQHDEGMLPWGVDQLARASKLLLKNILVWDRKRHLTE